MARIITHTTVEKLQTKYQGTVDAKGSKDFEVAIAREPDFAELHALFEIQYNQFLTDTSDEIAKRAQRLMELESIVYGSFSPK